MEERVEGDDEDAEAAVEEGGAPWVRPAWMEMELILIKRAPAVGDDDGVDGLPRKQELSPKGIPLPFFFVFLFPSN